MASEARMTERLSRRKHEVLMLLRRYKRQNIIRIKKGSVASQARMGMFTSSHSLYFFFLQQSTLPSTSKHTPMPEGSTMAAPAPHLSKGKESMKDKINNSRCNGRLTRGQESPSRSSNARSRVVKYSGERL